MLLFVLGPSPGSEAPPQAVRYARMARALSASAPVALACPTGDAPAAPHLCLKKYDSAPGLLALFKDAVVVVIRLDLLNTFPDLARSEARLVLDVSKSAMDPAALRAGEFFLCASESERERCLESLVAAGRLGRRRPDADLRRLVDVVDIERLDRTLDDDELERAVDPLRLFYTSSARLPRGWAWNPPSTAARAWRVIKEEGLEGFVSRARARLRLASRLQRQGPRVNVGGAAAEVARVQSLSGLREVLAARGLAGASPRFVDLEIDVSNRCNIRCKMCYFSFDETFHAKPVHLKANAFEAIAGRILPHAKSVMLSLGSEPLLSPEFPRILEAAGRYQVPELGFYTNGLLMDDRIVDAILAHGVTLVAVSIDGATRATFESIRRGADFDLLVRNVRGLTARRAASGRLLPRIRFGVVMMRQNIEELPDIVTLAWRLGVEELNFFHAVVYEGLDMDRESLVHYKALSNECLALALGRAQALGLRVVHHPAPFGVESDINIDVSRRHHRAGSRQPTPYCRFPFFHLSIDSSGRVSPCPFAHGEPPLGTIGPDTPVEAIWFGPAITDLRRRILTNDPPAMCRRCSFLASGQPDRSELFEARPN